MGNRNAKSSDGHSQDKTANQPDRSSRSKLAYYNGYPFNFFANLPDLARHKLVRQMKLQDLILLSSCSKRCAMAIRISRVAPVTISIMMRSDLIEIGMPGGSLWWDFLLAEFKTTEKVFKIKDIPVTMSRDNFLETSLKNNLDAAVNTAIAQILFIIPSSKFSLLHLDLVDRFPADFRCEIALAEVSQVKEMRLCGSEDPCENIKYVLENIQATEKIADSFIHQETDIIDKKSILTTKNLYFNRAEFLKPFDHFPSTSTVTANFCDVQFDKKVLIKFLNWFKSAPAEQLRNFEGIK